MSKNARDNKDPKPTKKTPSMPDKHTEHSEIVKSVAQELKPHIENLIDVKLKPIETELKSMQLTFSKEFKAIMSEIKTPRVGNDVIIPKSVNKEELAAGKSIDPMFNQAQEQPQASQPAPQGQMDMNKIIGEAMKDPQLAGMLKQFGVTPGGGMPQPGMPQPGMNMMQTPVNPPDFANMSPQQLQWMQQQQAMQMMPMLLQFIAPMLQQNQGGQFMEMMMRKHFSDMAYQENFNRSMMGFFTKNVFKDPEAFRNMENYNDAQMRYTSPIAQPGMYSPPNYPTSTQGLHQQAPETQGVQEQK